MVIWALFKNFGHLSTHFYGPGEPESLPVQAAACCNGNAFATAGPEGTASPRLYSSGRVIDDHRDPSSGQRGRERERETAPDRQTDRQADRQNDSERERERETETEHSRKMAKWKVGTSFLRCSWGSLVPRFPTGLQWDSIPGKRTKPSMHSGTYIVQSRSFRSRLAPF